MANREIIASYLKDIPSEWREKLTDILVKIKEDRLQDDCSKVQECETVTSLSTFSQTGGVVSVIYTDEEGVQVTRSFSVANVANDALYDIDPACLTSQTNWRNLSFPQKIQLLIDTHCNCCG